MVGPSLVFEDVRLGGKQRQALVPGPWHPASTKHSGHWKLDKDQGRICGLYWMYHEELQRLLTVLASHRPVMAWFVCEEFKRGGAEGRALDWYTEGMWRSHVLSEDREVELREQGRDH